MRYYKSTFYLLAYSRISSCSETASKTCDFKTNRELRQIKLQIIYIIKGDMFICLSVCLLPMAGRTAGPIKTKLGIGTHVDPRSVLVKVNVKVIYLCVRYKKIHVSDTWRVTTNHARSISSAVAAATW